MDTNTIKRNSMFKHLSVYFIIFLILLSNTDLSAQQKYEKESRIKPRDVPQKALNFIDSANIKAKLKWYFEQGLNRSSVEVKFRQNKQKHSVEFDTLGNIEDIEIEIKQSDLDATLKDVINAHLKKDCIKHRIEKIQRQFSGSRPQLIAKLKNLESIQNLVIKYEVVVRCTSRNKVELLEYLFDDKGAVLSTSKIIFKNSSHLEY
jgi:hypothetical protein